MPKKTNPEPPLSAGEVREAVLKLYKPPFHYGMGYIWDSQSKMVADKESVKDCIISRVRGWGRISYLPHAAQLQDEVGAVVAEALNKFWEDNKPQQEQ